MIRFSCVALMLAMCVVLTAGEPDKPEWNYIPLHGGNGRLVKIRGHRDAKGGASIELSEWTYEGVTNGNGRTLYVRADKLGAVLEALADRVEAQEKRK